MPMRYSNRHGNRRVNSLPIDLDDPERLMSLEAADSNRHFAVDSNNSFARPTPEVQEMECSKGPISCVRTPLSASSYSEFNLLHHLHRISRTNTATVLALGDVYRQRDELTTTTIFSLDSSIPSISDGSPSCEVYDVSGDSSVIARNQRKSGIHDEASESSTIWSMIKDVNHDGSAVGRITILHQPSPTAFASIHLAMEDHFDMDELFSHIIPHKGAHNGKTVSHVRTTTEPRPFHQRTFSFVFKYYTIVDEGCIAAQWQRHSCGSSDREPTDHVNISECSSIVALSLERQSFDTASRQTDRQEHFAPFHVLNIRCFPDNFRSTQNFDEESCYSGPYAFLKCLDSEYKNAAQRFSRLNERIGELALPSTDFIFDLQLRDQLLFEDAEYTFSRRYFWAFNCLAMINDSIRSMIDAYTRTFTDKFWLGKDPNLWPHPDPESAEERNYLGQLYLLRHEMDRSTEDLRSLIKSNDQLRQQIESLREQLYSGSSVKENRMAIEQGENIKILTGVSMLFLPLSFVTSVFGMQMFTIPPSDWRFVVTMIAVCVPFFFLIFVLQTHAGMSIYRRTRTFIEGRHRSWKTRAASRRERHAQLQQAEVIRRQSCATTVVGGQRESVWKFDSSSAQGIAAHSLDESESGQSWWRWPRKASKELSGSKKDLNV